MHHGGNERAVARMRVQRTSSDWLAPHGLMSDHGAGKSIITRCSLAGRHPVLCNVPVKTHAARRCSKKECPRCHRSQSLHVCSSIVFERTQSTLFESEELEFN